MDKLRLRNYRCFDDTGDIELKPVTLLLGANSSGKSSFIKFFPLLQQSLETKVNGLFLWDGQYVDFKDFKNTVRNGEGEISIDYTIGLLGFSAPFVRKEQQLRDVVVSMTICEKEEYYDYLKELNIRIAKDEIKYIFSREDNTCSVEVNGSKPSGYANEKISTDFDKNLFPTLRYEYQGNDIKINGPVSQLALIELNDFFGKEKKSGLDLLLNEGILDLFALKLSKVKEEIRKRKPEEAEERVIHATNLVLYMLAGQLVKAVNDYFAEMSRHFSYVLPLRSIMSRYYRFQNRNVDNIDPDGDNLAMFLNSLSKKRFDDFNKWLFDIFKFRLSITKTEGHVELYIEENDKPKRNLVDVGFGFTQILPILTIIWKSVYDINNLSSSKGIPSPITIAIEQPELHLHPRFQAFFALMLANVMGFCKKRKAHLRIIIETHSEVIINKIGELIGNANNGIGPEDVNVVLFNASNEGLEKYIHSTQFSKNGGLMNWPFGFFAEDVY